MTEEQANYFVNTLNKAGVQFDKGLTNREIEQIRDEFKVNFPPDLKLFLLILAPYGNSRISNIPPISFSGKENTVSLNDSINRFVTFQSCNIFR